MPWIREGSCVYKENADGTKGAKEGCSTSPAAAKKYMASLYANSEMTSAKKKALDLGDTSSEPTPDDSFADDVEISDDTDAVAETPAEDAAEDADELIALFPLGAQADISRIQDTIRGMIPDANFINPEDFHITAVYVDSGDLSDIRDSLSYSYDFQAIALLADSIGCFETPEGYAIYIGVRWNSDLRYMQQRLFYAMVGDGNMVSSFSLPDWWQPHITLCYSKTPISPISITPFAILVDAVEISDGNQVPLIEQQMKSSTLEFKSMQLEVIAKGVEFNAEGDLIIPVMGHPFTGPVKGVADYEGDWFHKDTQFGNVSEVLAFWDHGRDENYLIKELKSMGLEDEEITALGPDFGFGKHDIGVAVKGDMTEDGIIYNVIVSRHTKYKHALARAAREGKIGASGEYKYFEYDKDVPGKVDVAPCVGMALTPSPFNTDAVVLKSIPLEGEMATNVKDKKVEVPAEGETKDKAAEVVAPVVQKTETLAEALKSKAAEIDKRIEAATQNPDEETVSISDFNAVRAEVTEMKGMLVDFLDQMKDAFPILADMITKGVVLELSEKSKESNLEFKAAEVFGKSKQQQSVNKGAAGLRHNNSAAMQGYPGSI